MELRVLKRTVGKAILRALNKHKHSLPLSCLAYFQFQQTDDSGCRHTARTCLFLSRLLQNWLNSPLSYRGIHRWSVKDFFLPNGFSNALAAAPERLASAAEYSGDWM